MATICKDHGHIPIELQISTHVFRVRTLPRCPDFRCQEHACKVHACKVHANKNVVFYKDFIRFCGIFNRYQGFETTDSLKFRLRWQQSPRVNRSQCLSRSPSSTCAPQNTHVHKRSHDNCLRCPKLRNDDFQIQPLQKTQKTAPEARKNVWPLACTLQACVSPCPMPRARTRNTYDRLSKKIAHRQRKTRFGECGRHEGDFDRQNRTRDAS